MEVIAFDLDDTLVPEVLFVKSGISYIAAWLTEKYPSLSARRITGCMETALMTRRNHYSALESYLEEAGMKEHTDMREIVAAFRSHIPDSDIYHLTPSLESWLQSLKAEGKRLALVTDGRSVTQRNKISAAGLLLYFDLDDIYISEETGHDKMSPDSFLAIMRKYAGADAYHYVGDNPEKDFLHPGKLGWKTHLAHPFPLAVHQGIPR